MTESPVSLPAEPLRRIRDHLEFLYGATRGAETCSRLEALLRAWKASHPDQPPARTRFSARDALLITYGDHITATHTAPLETLRAFLERELPELGVHILPFFPYTSDDGFSVVDYNRIDPDLGDWSDVSRIASSRVLMVDAVVNHVSASSAWFQGFLRDDPKYREYFIAVDPSTDLSSVFRPRTLPLLTPFETSSGVKHVWTTFSADQIDLNFGNPDVLLEVLESLLLYVHHGARWIRLDAVGFIWKEIGTTCIHLEGAHRIVKLMRAVMDAVAPGTVLVTETNVPHEDNIAYFGSALEGGGTDEAQMVYQFPLPPLVLHTFRTADNTALLNWLRGLETRDSGTAFFNFLASHDGIGVVPATGLISSEDVMALAAQVERHGGRVNDRGTPTGQRPYELCATLFDALSDPNGAELEEVKIKRFLAANAILLSLQGVPGIYMHSFFGSPNDTAALASSGINRRLNRHKFTHAELEALLSDPGSRASRVFAGMKAMLHARHHHDAFSPGAPQRILETSSGVIALERGEGATRVRCFVNISPEPQPVSSLRGRDLITDLEVNRDALQGYEVLWLEGESFAGCIYVV
jgi:glucosylglycerate phosphorylase